MRKTLDGKGVLGIGWERGGHKNVRNKDACMSNEAALMESMLQIHDIEASNAWKVKEHFENFVYRFFLGKRVVYQMVENYVKSMWSCFALVRTMMNLKGIFYFKSSSNRGMESMFENGPWSIRNSEDVNLDNEDIDSENDVEEDDMYEGQDIPDKIQAICDNLDIKV
ncbi:zinc knuckle CX2CX4HX4C containing protein [Tanacetum coccineum]